MQPEPYLPRLTARLSDGLLRLPDDFRARHAGFVRRCQRPDGGFPGREGGRDLPRPDEVTRFVLSRRRDGGGFAEFAPQRRSGTNSTAAAVGTLQLVGAAIPDEVRDAAADLIASRATDEGGLRATATAPLA